MKNIIYFLLCLFIISCSDSDLISKEEPKDIPKEEPKVKIEEPTVPGVVLNKYVINNTIKVSDQSGNTYEKLKNAISAATSGDMILLDIDVVFEGNKSPIRVNKELVFKGAEKVSGKYKLQRPVQEKVSMIIEASNVKVENILFENASQQLIFKGNHSNITVENCHFKNGRYTGLDFREGRFTDTNVLNSTFDDCKFGLQTFDCNVLDNFRIEGCEFLEGDHQLSLDNPNSTIEKHNNIVINNCTFGLTERFNIALANTKNVMISNCIANGGRGKYSQALHIEDKTSDVMVYKNRLICKTDIAVLLYATDKFGHGQGERLTEAQKLEYGSRNVTLNNNYIESGSADAAISVTYGKGYLRVKGNNTIVSGNRGVSSSKSLSNGMTIEIDEQTSIKGKTYAEIKQENDDVRKTYVSLR